MTDGEHPEPVPGQSPWAPWELPLLVGTLVLALVLRVSQMAAAPAITDNGDELDWAWQGMGLLGKGAPYGWSNLRVYPPGIRFFQDGKFFELVHPYLDHPPLFGLLVGGLAWLQGAREFTGVTAPMIRPVPIACSIVALLLVYLLGRVVIGAAPAMVGAALVATAPAAVLVQRQAEAEALLAPILLGSLLLLRMATRPGARRVAAAGLLACCAVAPMVKLSGVAVAAIATALLLAGGRWRLAALALLAGLVGVGAFFAYGAAFNWELFRQVVLGSEARRYGVLGVYQFISSPAGPGGANLQLRDGWWLFGWLALALTVGATRERRFGLVAWPILGYTVVIMLFAEHISYYGWFRIAVYPLVYLLAGWLAWRSVREPSAIGLLLLLTVGVASVVSPVLQSPNTESWAPNVYLLIGVLALLVTPSLVAIGRGTEASLRFARYAAGTALGIALLANVVASLDLTNIYRVL